MTYPPFQKPLTRRELLSRVGTGIGTLGLAAVMAEAEGLAPKRLLAAAGQPENSLTPKAPHFAPRATRLIHLLMNGGVSHVDTFDHKPLLEKYHGQRPAAVDIKTQRKTEGLMKSPFHFKRHGQSGQWVSELFPHVAECADDLCIINSMYTDLPEHVAGLLMMTVGAIQPNRPSMGSWLGYGLGTENQNLPGFISICHKGRHRPGEPAWNSSFLPGIYSGTFVDTENLNPTKVIPNLGNPYLSRSEQQRQVDLLSRMNQLNLEQVERDQALEARIQSFELAYRMQTTAPEAFDLSQETQATRDLYGIKDEPTYSTIGGRPFGGFAEGCLLARRLSERGVRVVQLAFAPDIAWDDHGDILWHRPKAKDCDQAIAALLKDLKARGLLDETLVLWGGEFGRTPTADPSTKRPGRDHNHYGFTVWLAGGGVKRGLTYGATDDFGMRAVHDRVHVHDLHATILHLMGPGPRTAHLPLLRPGFPAHRRARPDHPRSHRLVWKPASGNRSQSRADGQFCCLKLRRTSRCQ